MMEKASKLGFSLHQTVLTYSIDQYWKERIVIPISLIEYNWLNDW
jgi:hypothetical protein